MSILAVLFVSALASAPAPTVSLAGTTVDRSGRPVAGAEVWLVGPQGPEDAPIVAHGRTDEQGRFALDRPAALAGSGRYRSLTLWALRPGLRAAWRRFPGKLPGPESAVRLELGPSAGTEIRVVTPDEEPVARARVRVDEILNLQGVPDAVADRLEMTTDADGRATLDAFASDELVGIEVRAEEFGDQPRRFYPPTFGPKVIRLRTAVSASGRLVADDPKVVTGWKVTAWIAPAVGQSDRDGYWIGRAEAVTDDRGRFEFPAIAAGFASLTFRPPDGLPYRAKAPSSSSFSAISQNEFDVPVVKAARVTGVFRDRETGAPIPGVRINFYSQADGNRFPVTDARGRFVVYALPADLHVRAIGAPAPYVVTPGRGSRVVKLPEGVDHLDLEPFEMIRRGKPLEGVVLDESGRPVADAIVTGAWRLPEEKETGIRTAEAMSDEHGRFRLEEILPGAEVKVFARHRDLAMTGPVMARVGPSEPLSLRLDRKATATIRGRVLQRGGRPLANASIDLRLTARNDCIGYVMGSFTFEGTTRLRTGADGNFETPHELLRIGTYCVTAAAEGFVPGQGEETELAAGDVTTVPDLVLKRYKRSRTVLGRVVDRRGEPIVGAEVLQSGDGPNRTRARTDADGRFRINGVAERPAFLFAEKGGFRFALHRIVTGSGPVELVLDRSDQPAPAVPKESPWPISRAEERAIARRLLEPALTVDAGRDPYSQRQAALLAMARVDPDRVLAMIEDRVLPEPQGFRNAAALGLLEDDPRRALSVIEEDHDPASRIGGYLALFEEAPAGLRRDLLERSLAESRHVDNLGTKAELLARIGDGWLVLGDTGRAAPILRNARALCARSDRGQFPWTIQGLSASLAVVDLPSALAMVEGPGNAQARSNLGFVQLQLGEIAWRIAGTNPEEAERLLERLAGSSAYNRDEVTLRACRNMAGADLERARRLAARWLRPSPFPQGPERLTSELYARAVMVDGLADSNPQAARRLLDETIAELRRLGMQDRPRHEMAFMACLLAGCLPLVERLAPDRLEECLAMAIASRPPRGEEPDIADVRMLAILAAMVARYDPTAAEAIAQPVVDAVPELAVPPFRNGSPDGLEQVLAVLAGVDPRRAADLVERLPEDHEYIDVRFKQLPGVNFPRWINVKTWARVAVGRMLALPIERRRLEIGKLIVKTWLLRGSP